MFNQELSPRRGMEQSILPSADEELLLTTPETATERYAIKGTIDHFEKDCAVIQLENGQELLWPIDKLPEGSREGGSVRLTLGDLENDKREQANLAKTILNQILKPE